LELEEEALVCRSVLLGIALSDEALEVFLRAGSPDPRQMTRTPLAHWRRRRRRRRRWWWWWRRRRWKVMKSKLFEANPISPGVKEDKINEGGQNREIGTPGWHLLVRKQAREPTP